MDQQRFDDLARAVARGAPRRNVLKGLAAGLTSLVFGGMATEQAAASHCTPACGPCQTCQFDANRGVYRCITTCTACEVCRKAGPRGADPYICVPKCDTCSDCNPGPDGPNVGQCKTHCLGCQSCQNGVCIDRCGTTGRVCAGPPPNGGCTTCSPFTCGGPAPIHCGPTTADCICTRSVDGNPRCGNDFGCDTPSCTTNQECQTLLGPGAYCQAAGTGCCGQVCVPPCGVTVAAGARAASGKRNSG